MDLESLVRQHFSAEADAVDAPDLLRGVERRRDERSRRRARAAVLGGGLAVILAVGIPIAVARHDTVPSHATVHGSLRAAPTREVVWGGIVLDVPASWTTNRGGCGATDTDTVDYPVAYSVFCAARNTSLPAPAARSRLDLGPGTSLPVVADGPARATTFAGLPATETTGAADGYRVVHVEVPSRGVSFEVRTPTSEVADAVLGSARQVTAVDGCPTARPADDPDVTAPDGRRGPVVDGTPSSGVVCFYLGAWLDHAAPLAGSQVEVLVADLDSSPSAYSTAEIALLRQIPAGCGTDAVVRLTGTDTRAVTVVAAPCGGRLPGLTGARRAALSPALLQDLALLTPTGFGSATYGALPAGCPDLACGGGPLSGEAARIVALRLSGDLARATVRSVTRTTVAGQDVWEVVVDGPARFGAPNPGTDPSYTVAVSVATGAVVRTCTAGACYL